MDENTAKMIKERFEALPEMIQNLILSSHYQDTLLEIGKKYQLNVEQMGMLEQETTLVLMGLSPVKDFEVELTRELSIDKMKSNQIVTEINEKIFLTIRDLLKLMYTPKGEEPSVEEETEEKSINNDNIESREEMLNQLSITNDQLRMEKKEKTPDLTAEKELPAASLKELQEQNSKVSANNIKDKEEIKVPVVEKRIPSILDQKLSGAFKIPSTKTDYTLNNISKGSDVLEKTKTGIPNVDPYRELPQ